MWLQKEPDSTAKALLERLTETHPEQFSPKFLRTLQRRIGEWRQTMARKLVLGQVEELSQVQPIAAAALPAGQAALRLASLASAQPAPQGESNVCITETHNKGIYKGEKPW